MFEVGTNHFRIGLGKRRRNCTTSLPRCCKLN